MNPLISTLAVVSGDSLVSAVIWIVISGLVFWICTWLITYIGIPEPFNKVARAAVAIIAVILLINAILAIAGKQFIRW